MGHICTKGTINGFMGPSTHAYIHHTQNCLISLHSGPEVILWGQISMHIYIILKINCRDRFTTKIIILPDICQYLLAAAWLPVVIFISDTNDNALVSVN